MAPEHRAQGLQAGALTIRLGDKSPHRHCISRYRRRYCQKGMSHGFIYSSALTFKGTVLGKYRSRICNYSTFDSSVGMNTST